MTPKSQRDDEQIYTHDFTRETKVKIELFYGQSEKTSNRTFSPDQSKFTTDMRWSERAFTTILSLYSNNRGAKSMFHFNLLLNYNY